MKGNWALAMKHMQAPPDTTAAALLTGLFLSEGSPILNRLSYHGIILSTTTSASLVFSILGTWDALSSGVSKHQKGRGQNGELLNSLGSLGSACECVRIASLSLPAYGSALVFSGSPLCPAP